ncbi:MAG: hypothetical protein NZT61_02985 [Deltaproteobacteria bacterium]|nr:hypothetical protein [Deltaproteobacteria bacterium]MCX7952371.1 hypothetical protein [Deltaproteobacteria bacterium]
MTTLLFLSVITTSLLLARYDWHKRRLVNRQMNYFELQNELARLNESIDRLERATKSYLFSDFEKEKLVRQYLHLRRPDEKVVKISP